LAAFGSLSIALAIASYGGIVVQFAFHLTGPRHVAMLSPEESEADVVMRIGSAKLVLLACVLPFMALAATVAHVVGSPISLAHWLLLLAIPIAWTLHSGWHLQSIDRFGTISMISMIGAAAALALGLFGVKAGGPHALLLAAASLCAGVVVTGIGTFVFSVHRIGALRHWLKWEPPWGELRFGWPLFASQFAALLYGASGPILVGGIAGVAQAGVFSVAERVSNAVIAIGLLTHTAAYPRLALLFHSDRPAYRRVLRLVIAGYLGFAMIVTVAVVLLWSVAVSFLFGAGSHEHQAMLVVAMPLLVIGVFGPVLTGYLTISGRSGEVLPLTLGVGGGVHPRHPRHHLPGRVGMDGRPGFRAADRRS
jgi:O-antigen/teichoic acid export membrane protein